MPLGAFKAALMGTAGVSTGDVVLLSSQTASNDSTISFTSGITSTYGKYIFKFYNIEAASETSFSFQVSTDGGSNYGLSIMSSSLNALKTEDDSSSAYLIYSTGSDLANSTSFQRLTNEQGTGADEAASGELHLYNTSHTSDVKNWYSTLSYVNISHGTSTQGAGCLRNSGYVNSTSDIDAIQFKMETGNIVTGTIKMWGVSQ